MKTTYFDSLITNRVMDYTLDSGKTIRNIYEPGPFLNSLSSSKLSTHLGFNSFIELNDGKIIFIERNDKVSIGKNTIGTSIGASYKTLYGVDDDFNITNEIIGNAIKSEIYDELKIDVEKFGIDSLKLHQTIFALYRDIVEGGKPQFLFYLKLQNVSWEDFKTNFNGYFKNKYNIIDDKKSVITDGKRIIAYTIDEMKTFNYKINGFYDHNNVWHSAMPSVLASMKLFLECIDN